MTNNKKYTIFVESYTSSKDVCYAIKQTEMQPNDILETKSISITVSHKDKIKRIGDLWIIREALEYDSFREKIVKSSTVYSERIENFIDTETAKQILKLVKSCLANVDWCSFSYDKDLFNK